VTGTVARTPFMSDFRRLAPLIAATMFNIIGLGVTFPILQYYMLSYGGTNFQAALIFSLFSAASFLSAPVWGRLSDRAGRKPILLISVFATIGSYVWLAFASELWELFASRAFAGLMAGWMVTSQALVSDVTAPENRARGLGMLGAAFGVGFVIGPALGAVFVGTAENPDYGLPCLIAAGATGIGFLITAIFVRETRHAAERTRRHVPVRTVLSDPTTARLLAIHFAVYLIFTGAEGVFALWVKMSFDLGARDIGYYLAFAGVVAALVQGGLVGRLVKRIGEAATIAVAILCLSVGVAILPFMDSPGMIYLPMGLMSLGLSLHMPSLQSLLSRIAPPDWKGGVLGTAQSAASLARIAGPAAAGAMFIVIPESPFLLGGVLLVLIAVFAFSQMSRFRAAV